MTAKGTRITMTKAQAESPVGSALIDLILSMCHDGVLDIMEVEHLHAFLRGSESSPIPAVGFLRAKTRLAVADGSINEIEEYDLKKAFERVVPKEARGVVSTHLEGIGLPVASHVDTPPWTHDEATAKQIEYIVNLGGKVTPGMTKGEASVLIDQLLERRPPTPRQRMLLRFFNRLDLERCTKDEVSAWIDDLFCRNHRNELAWERFKRETGHDPFGQDPTVVPIGACSRYLRSKRNPAFRWLMLLGALGLIAIVVMSWHALKRP